MDVALRCAHCGSPSSGTRFCTSCGTDMSAAPSVPAPRVAHEQVTEQLAAPAPAQTAVLAPWAPAAPPPAVPRRPLDVLLALSVVAVLASGGWLIWGVERHTVTGSVVLMNRTFSDTTPGTRCTGIGSDSHLTSGAAATLTSPRGETLASGRLAEGEVDGVGCVFTFRIDDVPRVDEYVLSVGGVNQGSWTDDELSADDWSVEISLGNS